MTSSIPHPSILHRPPTSSAEDDFVGRRPKPWRRRDSSRLIPHPSFLSLRKLVLFSIGVLLMNHAYSQGSPNDNTRIINRKLKILSSPSADVAGGYVTNNSYEGLKGGPFLFDEFRPLIIRVTEIDLYVSVDANLDLISNSLLYKDPETGQLYSIPSGRVVEAVFKNENDTLVFKTTENKIFEPDLKETKFYQVLKGGPNEFIRIPFKIFIPADYSGAYTAKRRFDEYKTEYRYFILNSEMVYKQVKLSKRSLIKVFPEKKELIRSSYQMKTESDKEEVFLSVLDKL